MLDMAKERIDLSLTVVSQEHLHRAKSLAKLAQSTTDQHDARTLSGAALLLAIAHLAQAAETQLIAELLLVTVKKKPKYSEVDARIEIDRLGLTARLKRLAETKGLRLNTSWARPKRLFAAVQLRNELAHMEGVVVAGSAVVDAGAAFDPESGFPVSPTKHKPVFRNGNLLIPVPQSAWRRVTEGSGLDTIADVEGYLGDLERLGRDRKGASAFFSMIRSAVH